MEEEQEEKGERMKGQRWERRRKRRREVGRRGGGRASVLYDGREREGDPTCLIALIRT